MHTPIHPCQNPITNHESPITTVGKAWESNPPQPALRRLPLILKTRAPTGTHPLPQIIVLDGVVGDKTTDDAAEDSGMTDE